MTDQINTDASTEGQQAGGDLFNTAAGWVLFAAGLGLGLSILSDKYFHGSDPERPEQLGYVIEGVEVADGPVIEKSMAQALSEVTAEQGEKIYAKCAACHTIAPSGANGVGPNLHNIMGSAVGARAGYTYSSAMAAKGGQWGWEEMNEWLKKPSSYVEGTKMSFAGLSKIEDRAAVALFMNGPDATLAVPEYTPPEPEASEEAAEEAAVEEAEANQEDAAATSEETAAAEA
ncbi:MAG: c-type cytochrome [Pseudomonadota bacterium]